MYTLVTRKSTRGFSLTSSVSLRTEKRAECSSKQGTIRIASHASLKHITNTRTARSNLKRPAPHPKCFLIQLGKTLPSIPSNANNLKTAKGHDSLRYIPLKTSYFFLKCNMQCSFNEKHVLKVKN